MNAHGCGCTDKQLQAMQLLVFVVTFVMIISMSEVIIIRTDFIGPNVLAIRGCQF